MTKNKKGKVVQMLSPENYIRKKARTLPLYECLVPSDWEETKMASVIIARQHTNGNITACSYVVDLGCLGVKDTMFLFNVPIIQYSDFKDKMNTRMEMTEVDYPLAHNIILAGVEYAAEFGFKPYKEYESITKFMLQEDTDEIELIEIECGGEDGKPLYVQGPFEDHARARQIIAQLEKTAGPGNYDFMMGVNDSSDEEYDEEDWDEEDDLFEEDELEAMTFEEKKELFLTLSKDPESMKIDQSTSLFDLADSIADDLVDRDQYQSYYDQFFDDLNIEVTVDEIPDQLLGIQPGDKPVPQQLKDRFLDLHSLCLENTKLAHAELKLFKEAYNDIPGTCLLELLLLEIEKSPTYEKRLEEYVFAYPDYATIQLMWAIWQLDTVEDPQILPGFPFKAETFFAGRESIHAIEWVYLLMLYSFTTGIEMDINKIQAFGDVVYDLELAPGIEKILLTTNSLQKIAYVISHMEE